LKVRGDELSVTNSGRLFHARGPATQAMISLPARYVVNILCRRRRHRATATVVCLLIVGALVASTLTAWNDLFYPVVDRDSVDWEAEFERARRESLRDHMSFYVAGNAKLKPVPLDWTSRNHCPACFGTDMCDAVERQVSYCRS